MKLLIPPTKSMQVSNVRWSKRQIAGDVVISRCVILDWPHQVGKAVPEVQIDGYRMQQVVAVAIDGEHATCELADFTKG